MQFVTADRGFRRKTTIKIKKLMFFVKKVLTYIKRWCNVQLSINIKYLMQTIFLLTKEII